MATATELRGQTILITGATGQVAGAVVEHLAPDNRISVLGRFLAEGSAEPLQALGVEVLRGDLARGELPGEVGDHFDSVLNFAVAKTGDWEYDLAANAGGAARLMLRCPSATFLHCSSTAVYQYQNNISHREDSPLGDSHRAMFPTYSISKIAAESQVRTLSAEMQIPAVILRINVPYGRHGGWPYYHLLAMQAGAPVDIHPDRPNYYNLIHETDYCEKLPALLNAARPGGRVLNIGGSERTSIEQWCEYIAELTGLDVHFRETTEALGSVSVDTGAMHEVAGETRIPWRDGIREMIATLAPDALG